MSLPQAAECGSALVSRLHCATHIQKDRALKSLCTLGGGNHFIELGCDAGESINVLTVHSGSRNLGNQVYEWYMKAGQKALKDRSVDFPYEMTWLDGDLKEQYLADVQIVCDYAKLNRELMINEIVKAMKWKKYLIGDDGSLIDCPHNFVGWDGILRKGAIMADELQNVLIPVNTHDGIIVGFGKGNTEWNYSAPHGSGRILKRSEVANEHTVSEFKHVMCGVWSSCVNTSTLDESPFAYRQLDDILPSICQTVCVDPENPVIKPLYNFKACDGAR